MVPSRIELLIPALLARCLNQLGQGTNLLVIAIRRLLMFPIWKCVLLNVFY